LLQFRDGITRFTSEANSSSQLRENSSPRSSTLSSTEKPGLLALANFIYIPAGIAIVRVRVRAMITAGPDQREGSLFRPIAREADPQRRETKPGDNIRGGVDGNYALASESTLRPRRSSSDRLISIDEFREIYQSRIGRGLRIPLKGLKGSKG